MNIIVLMKQVPDTATQVEISADKRQIMVEDVKWTINPYDEFSLEEALRIKEKLGTGKVTTLIVGPDQAAEAIRIAYAMGIDEAILVKDQTDGELCAVDAYTTAKIIAGVLKKRPYDLIIAGQRAVDDDSYQVPAYVSQMLNIPMISTIVRQEISNGKIKCEQIIDSGSIVLEAALPALFTTQKGINEPRYPNFRAIMKAKKRPFAILDLKDAGLTPEDVGHNRAKIKIRSLSYPPEREAGIVIKGDSAKAKAAELVRLLREAAAV